MVRTFSLESVLNGALAHLAGLQSLNVSRSVLDNDSSQTATNKGEVAASATKSVSEHPMIAPPPHLSHTVASTSPLQRCGQPSWQPWPGPSRGEARLPCRSRRQPRSEPSCSPSCLRWSFRGASLRSSGKSHFKFLQFCICTIKTKGTTTTARRVVAPYEQLT